MTRSLTPLEVDGEKTYHAEMLSNLWDSTKAFYGLGQHQTGVWNCANLNPEEHNGTRVRKYDRTAGADAECS